MTFPEYRQAAEAAVKYINDYKGGIGGHPVKLETCATDGQPATSGRCAGQIADKKPAFILGGADTGAPGAFPVWKRADLAVIGGIPFTPVESNAPNAVAVHLGVGRRQRRRRRPTRSRSSASRRPSVIYTDDTQGKFTGLGVIARCSRARASTSRRCRSPPNAADFSSVAAAAIENAPDMVYVNSPNACPGMLKALKSVGNTGEDLRHRPVHVAAGAQDRR